MVRGIGRIRRSPMVTDVARRLRAAWRELIGTPHVPAATIPDAEPIAEHWWHLLPFSTHRIGLVDDLYTCVGGVDAAVDARTKVIVDECGSDLTGLTIVDLGCLEGAFTIELARRGASCAVGIEARELSVRRCELVRSLLHLDNARFILGDVTEELPRLTEQFDVVLATGVLYHLADPAAFIVTMRRACRGFALIDTHVANATVPWPSCSPELVTHRSGGSSYRGRTFREFDTTISAPERDQAIWASWSNPDSFWPLEAELVRMLDDAGFSSIRKVGRHDDSTWQVDRTDRVMYLCRP